MDAVLEMMVVERVINTMQTHMKVSVSEKKPKTGGKAGVLDDDYLHARGHERAMYRTNSFNKDSLAHK